MTFVGKILVVVQLVLSVCFMTFAGAVLAVQTSWKAEAEKLQTSLQTAQNTQATTSAEFDTYRSETELRLTEARERADRVEAANTALREQLATVEERYKSLGVALASEREVARLATEEADFRLKEAVEQRIVNQKLQASRDDLAKELRSLKDTLFSKDLEIKAMVAKQDSLLKENRNLSQFLRQVAKIEYDPNLLRTEAEPPPVVEGKINSSQKSASNRFEYVEVSVGSDDGLRVGHEMYMYRDNKYLGKIQIVSTEPDRAVGTVIERTKNSSLQKGDNVTTKL